MGFLITKIFDFFSGSKNNFKILILGIQNAGKTSILYRLSLGQFVKTTHTIGSNVEEINHQNVKMQAWDLGGQEKMRSVWDVYYLNSDAIIYVIDSNDFENFEESKNQFYLLLKNEALKNAVLLIFANKQDLITSKKIPDLIQIYDFDKIKDHIWHIQPCSALTGEGLEVGIKWLSDQLTGRTNFPKNPYIVNESNDNNVNNTTEGNKVNTDNSSGNINSGNRNDGLEMKKNNSENNNNNREDNIVKKEEKKSE